MGCGKSSVGKVLSARLGCPVTDLDAAIVERIGCTIPAFFARHGEADFRTLESVVLSDVLAASLAGQPLTGHTPSPLTPGNEEICRSGRGGVSGGTAPAISAVLALGGGTVMTPDCAEQIHTQTCCIYLRATVNTLVQRLRNEAAGRPMLRTHTPDSCAEPSQMPADADIALRERISSLLAQRSAIYESVAHHIIDVDGLSVEDVARSILSTI